MEYEGGSTISRSHCLEKSLCKRLWTCRKAHYEMNWCCKYCTFVLSSDSLLLVLSINRVLASRKEPVRERQRLNPFASSKKMLSCKLLNNSLPVDFVGCILFCLKVKRVLFSRAVHMLIRTLKCVCCMFACAGLLMNKFYLQFFYVTAVTSCAIEHE
jgi:hypothetical protein